MRGFFGYGEPWRTVSGDPYGEPDGIPTKGGREVKEERERKEERARKEGMEERGTRTETIGGH